MQDRRGAPNPKPRLIRADQLEIPAQSLRPLNLQTFRFDDSECMADVIDGLVAAESVNRTMIAKRIARWFVGTYVTADT